MFCSRGARLACEAVASREILSNKALPRAELYRLPLRRSLEIWPSCIPDRMAVPD
jgi:hypothetical protein